MLTEDSKIRAVWQICGAPILCCESALYQLELSTYVDRHPCFLSKYQEVKTYSFEYIKGDTEEDIFTNCRGYRVTTPQRTLCDMIRYDRCEEFLYQGLSDYIFDGLDISSLRETAKKYGVLERIDELIEEINNSPPYWSN